MWTIDFETKGIIAGSPLSPEPVGLAVKKDDTPGYYFAWGHPTQNNCDKCAPHIVLTEIMASDELVLCHNAKFDLRIVNEHFDLPYPKKVADTMLMAFLNNPRDKSLALKPLAEKYLKIPPDERDAVKEWVIAYIKKATQKTWGGYISEAPGDLVGQYAIMDVEMTYALYNFYLPIINEERNCKI
jgi:DNA polymerase I-like protein with 3'-5' exonuclease and polymerase domains